VKGGRGGSLAGVVGGGDRVAAGGVEDENEGGKGGRRCWGGKEGRGGVGGYLPLFVHLFRGGGTCDEYHPKAKKRH